MNEDIKAVEMLYTLLTGTIIPIVVLWLQRVSWPSYYKFGLAVALSVIAATLMGILDGKLTAADTINNFVTLFTISQTVYFTFFRALNLHAFLYPDDVLINRTKDVVAKSIEMAISPELARDILDDAKPEELSVKIDVTEAQG
jgi:hypothetical protein